MSAALSSSLYISPKKPSSPQQSHSTILSTKPTTLQTHPLFTIADQTVTLHMKEKILCLELMGIDSGKTLSLNPCIRSASLDSIESVLHFLQSKGIYPNDLPRILGMCPTILTSDIRTELSPVFVFLTNDLNVPENAFRKVVKKCPRLLVSSVEDQLKPALFYLRRLGFKDLYALAYQDPVLLVSSVEHILIPKLRFLESIGFSRAEAIGMILRCPALFTFSIENNFKPKLDYFMSGIKGKLENLKDFPQYFAFSLEKRIKPRHLESTERGLELPLSLMLKSTDEEFEQLLLLTKPSSVAIVDNTAVVPVSSHELPTHPRVLESKVYSNSYEAEQNKPVPIPVSGYPPFVNQGQQQHYQVIYTGQPYITGNSPMTFPATTYHHHPNQIHYQLPPQPYPIYFIPVQPNTVLNTQQVNSPVVRTSSPLAPDLSSQVYLPPKPVDSSGQTSSEATLSSTCRDDLIYNNDLDDDTARAQIYKSQPPTPIVPSDYQT